MNKQCLLPGVPQAKRLLLTPLAVCVLLGATVAARAENKPWPPPGGAPLTQWGKEISPDKPVFPEYPRPQLVRTQWLNLDGLWKFAVVGKDDATPANFDGTILVPFPPESVLSKVNAPVGKDRCAWYRRSVVIPVAWAGQRIMLHFDAVNWKTRVWVNGRDMGTHDGGYDSFSFDITDALTASGPQDVTVSAWNPVQGGQPRGKQSLKPGGIFYTPTTGIWQPVWLEPVPASHIESLSLVPDVDKSELQLGVAVSGGKAGQQVDVVVLEAGREVARASGKPGEKMAIPIIKARLWWPASPFLYDVKVTLKDGGKSVDEVGSYFGMRKISIGHDDKGRAQMWLNNKFIFQNGFLDQGFWPDGIYTAPSDAALRYDIEATRKLGYNMLRKHIKVEPERWYYWADKLGILVWQDMPASPELGHGPKKGLLPDMEGQFEMELRRMVQGRRNHPCIIVWVAFNEGWGLSVKKKAAPGEKDSPAEGTRAREERMFNAVKQEDPTRLIDVESGTGGGAGGNPENFWDFGLGDFVDYHCYGGKTPPAAEKNRVGVVGESGYGISPLSVERLVGAAPALGFSAVVVTQLCDVENETNGALNYDRTLKKATPLEDLGRQLIEHMHKAGYIDYPGGPGTAVSSASR